MQKAATMLVGSHDFASFTRLNHGRESTIRTIHACDILETGDRELTITVEGDGFLWNMVRIIAGTLVEVGAGRRSVDSIDHALVAADRATAGVTMPPEGLSLLWIRYGLPGSGRDRQLHANRAAQGVGDDVSES